MRNNSLRSKRGEFDLSSRLFIMSVKSFQLNFNTAKGRLDKVMDTKMGFYGLVPPDHRPLIGSTT